MPTATKPLTGETGPFRAEQLREGDRYELHNGHPIYCAPSGREHAGRNLTGAAVLETDPAVDWAGVDAGFTPAPGSLRAPDIAVGPVGDERGWISGVPPLAVEYAGQGQRPAELAELAEKVAELLRHGTQLVWVVHLVGPWRVEVHSPQAPMRLLGPGDELTAPGILRNPVPVEALYDRNAGHRAVLRNLLQRQGYEDIDAILREGVAQGLEQGMAQGLKQGMAQGLEQGMAESILALLADRGLAIDAPARARIQGCRDRAQLQRWLLAAARADDLGFLADPGQTESGG